MKRGGKIQYTVRGVPPVVDRWLRAGARRHRQSLNQALLRVLLRATRTTSIEPHSDLDSFFGSWTADTLVERALAEQRRVDPKIWR
jgi:hypothetical protein